jgi:prepilin-type N-terminal cleavage/methylation domain-containing protein
MPYMHGQQNNAHSPHSTQHLARAAGFSLLELLIVVSVIVVASAMAIPVMQNARRGYQLRGATVDLASLLQRSRNAAIQNNRAMSVLTVAGNTQVFLDLNGNGLIDPGEPMVQLPANVVQINAGAPQIAAPGTLGFTGPQNPPARFNGRGMPCIVVGGICTNYPAGQPEVGFVFYLNQNINGSQRWSAVSVTPGGQVKTWSRSNGVWTNI